MPRLNDLAFLEYDDLIRMANGAQAVSDDDAGAVGHHFVDGILYQAFAFGIERRGGFVQILRWEDFSIRPGRWLPLAFATTQLAATVADIGLIILFLAHDEIMGIGNACRLFNFINGGYGVAQ